MAESGEPTVDFLTCQFPAKDLAGLEVCQPFREFMGVGIMVLWQIVSLQELAGQKLVAKGLLQGVAQSPGEGKSCPDPSQRSTLVQRLMGNAAPENGQGRGFKLHDSSPEQIAEAACLEIVDFNIGVGMSLLHRGSVRGPNAESQWIYRVVRQWHKVLLC